jgi:polar amino acid transport system permease protein
MSEIVRGAVGSIPTGQTDAAKALGLTFWPRIRWVLLPQALPIMLPPWTNLAAELFKGTSLAVLVSQTDFLFALQKVAARTKDYIPLYVFGLIVYFVCSFVISRSGVWLRRRMRHALAA